VKSVSARSTCSGEALVVKSNRIRSSEHATWHLSKSEMLGGDWTSIFGSLQLLRAKVDGTVGDANPLDAIEDAPVPPVTLPICDQVALVSGSVSVHLPVVDMCS
jgi:hypothetical protein